MASKQSVNTHRTTQRLQRYGFDADPKSVRVHKSETIEHVVVRRIAEYILQNAGIAWDEEVEVTESGDRVDVVSYRSEGALPIGLEFESAPDRPTKDSKIERYVESGPLADVLFFDLRECPDTLDDIETWIEAQLAV